MLKAVLLDVGGTLWPDDGPRRPILLDGVKVSPLTYTERQMTEALPHLPSEKRSAFIATLNLAADTNLQPGVEFDTHETIRRVGREFGMHSLTGKAVQAIRRAMIVPFTDHVPMFDGAQSLFAAIRRAALRCVIVSNTVWRDSEAYRTEFESYGLADAIHGYVTSADVGVRKPDHRMFTNALALAGAAPHEALMVGNSEHIDILPVKELGLRSIRVCIEEPRAPESVADAVVTSLDEVADLISRWIESR